MSAEELMLLNCGVGEDFESPLDWRSVLAVHWKDWCWSWDSSSLATSCEALTHFKRPWCWEGWRSGGEGDNRGWFGWMASPTQWTWVWMDFGSWWGTGWPGVLRFIGSQRVGHDCATELRWLNVWTQFKSQCCGVIVLQVNKINKIFKKSRKASSAPLSIFTFQWLF